MLLVRRSTMVQIKEKLAKLKKFKIKLNFKKPSQEAVQTPPPKPVPRGFKIIEILLCSHGSGRNDTIVTVEQKIQTTLRVEKEK